MLGGPYIFLEALIADESNYKILDTLSTWLDFD
jgi:hypothetical protein